MKRKIYADVYTDTSLNGAINYHGDKDYNALNLEEKVKVKGQKLFTDTEIARLDNEGIKSVMLFLQNASKMKDKGWFGEKKGGILIDIIIENLGREPNVVRFLEGLKNEVVTTGRGA